MAAAEILAAGTAEANSTEVVLTDGQGATIAMKPANNAVTTLPPDAAVDVQIKTSDAGWVSVPGARLTVQNPASTIVGPGTYRAVRRAVTAAIGIDRN